MAENSSKCFLFLVFMLFCCSGTLVKSTYEPRIKSAYSSILDGLSTFVKDKAFPFQFHVLASAHSAVNILFNNGGSANAYFEQTQHVNQNLYIRIYRAFPASEPHPKLEISSVIVTCSSFKDCSKGNELQMLLPILRSTNSLLKGLQLKKPIKVSVALPLSLLTSLSLEQIGNLDDILSFVGETRSFMLVDGEGRKADGFIQTINKKSNLVFSLLSHADVPVILSYKSSYFDRVINLSALDRRSLHKYPKLFSTLTSLLSSRRKLQLLPPTTVTNPTTPVTNPTTPSTIPQYTPAPTVFLVPGTNTDVGTPPSPVTLPFTNPVPLTSPVSVTPTAPVTNPVTSPVTNPVTTYPPPSTIGSVPTTTSPVTTTPATSAPVIPGQTWCIARSGAVETALQSALDYACGIGGADCSTIQEGASCYNPNTLENHASYAFNSYFQKNPGATSCDFGGTAVLVNTNPSSGTCVYPSSATTATPSTISPITTNAPSTVPPATTASTPGGTTGTDSSYGTPPLVFNTSTGPTPGFSTPFGFGTPPMITTPPSGSAGVQPLFAFISLTTLMILLGV